MWYLNPLEMAGFSLFDVHKSAWGCFDSRGILGYNPSQYTPIQENIPPELFYGAFRH